MIFPAIIYLSGYPWGMATRSEEAKREAWRAFLRAHRALMDVLGDELESEQDLPLTWYEVLAHLDRAPDARMRMNELADSLLLSRSGITRLVDRMEKDGLVSRATCPTDRRGWHAILTPDGRRRLRMAAPVHLSGVEEHFARHFTVAEANTLAAVFGRVLGPLSK